MVSPDESREYLDDAASFKFVGFIGGDIFSGKRVMLRMEACLLTGECEGVYVGSESSRFIPSLNDRWELARVTTF